MFLQRAQCSHCKRCISYGNSVRPSVRPSVTRRYCVKTRSLQEWVGHFEAKFQGEGVVPGEYFLVPTKLDTFFYPTRGVTTAGDTGDASPVRPTMSPYIKMTTDSLSSELTFDE